VAWSKDGKHILTGGLDRTIRQWDATNGKLILTISPAHPGGLHAVLFSDDGKQAVSCGGDRAIVVWNLATARRSNGSIFTPPPFEVWRGCQMANRSPRPPSTAPFAFWISRAARKSVRWTTATRPYHAWFVAVSPDGKRIASTGSDKMIRLWDAETGKQVKEFAGHTEGVHGIAYSADGKRLLSAGSDKSARLWDIQSGKEVQRIEVPERVTCVAFSPTMPTRSLLP